MATTCDQNKPAVEVPKGKRLVSGLFFWQFKKLFLINLFAVIITGLYVLLRVAPFTSQELFLLSGILLHSWLIAWKLGRSPTRQTRFLYAWGFTRDQIWWHSLLASIASGALICGVAWLMMVSQLRCFVQDQLLTNPYFPAGASSECWIPWLWLYGYGITLPLMHYAFVRSRQSVRGGYSGWAILVFGISILTWSFFKSSPPAEMIEAPIAMLTGLAVLFIPATVLLIIAGRRIHGTMEAL